MRSAPLPTPNQAAAPLLGAAPMLTKKHPPEVLAEIEAAYRRGYSQAAYCAARDAADGHDLKAWARACEKWRHAARFGPKSWAAIGTCPPEAWEVNP